MMVQVRGKEEALQKLTDAMGGDQKRAAIELHDTYERNQRLTEQLEDSRLALRTVNEDRKRLLEEREEHKKFSSHNTVMSPTSSANLEQQLEDAKHALKQAHTDRISAFEERDAAQGALIELEEAKRALRKALEERMVAMESRDIAESALARALAEKSLGSGSAPSSP